MQVDRKIAPRRVEEGLQIGEGRRLASGEAVVPKLNRP